MAVTVGSAVPDMPLAYWQSGKAEAEQLSLHDYAGRWLILAFYARDFTFICPSELEALAEMEADFEREGAAIVAASTDSYFSHEAWFKSEERLSNVRYPIIADADHKLARAFGVLAENGGALRGTFIVNPDGIVRHVSINEVDIGRNFAEILRILRALRSGELCPVGWAPGTENFDRYGQWLTRAFPRLKDSTLAAAAERVGMQFYDAGDVIIQQGAEADRFFILVKGDVSVIQRIPGSSREVEIARMGPGEVFGEIGILQETRRTADVRANSSVSLLSMDFEDFRTLVNQSDPTAEDFMKIIEQRRATHTSR